jgi:uncharacterized phage protein gp47/JayE
MASYGLTAAGFVTKPLAQILTDMQTQVLATIDPAYDLSPDSPDGQFLGIVANESASNWELLQVLYGQYNREDAEGAALDNLGDITGTPREGASYSQVYMNLVVDPTMFTSFPYAPGSLVFNVAGNQALTFANASTITSSMLAGDTLANILFQATIIGPTVTVNPGSLNQITNSVSGLLGGNNPTGLSQMGTNEELDSAYAPRQEADLFAEGSCTTSAVAAQLNELGAAQEPPVTLLATVLENTLNVPQTIEGVTLPPHTYAPYVYAPDDPDWLYTPLGGTVDVTNGSANITFSVPQTLAFNQLIAFASQPDVSYYVAAATSSSTTATLTQEYAGTSAGATTSVQLGPGAPLIAAIVYANKPAGIVSFGTTGVEVQDPILGPQLQSYSVPTPETLYISFRIAITAGLTFSTIAAAVGAALVAAAVAPTPGTGVPPIGQLSPGSPVIGSQLSAVIQSVLGVVDVQALTFGFTSSPTNTMPISVPATSVAIIPANLSSLSITQGTLP